MRPERIFYADFKNVLTFFPFFFWETIRYPVFLFVCFLFRNKKCLHHADFTMRYNFPQSPLKGYFQNVIVCLVSALFHLVILKMW